LSFCNLDTDLANMLSLNMYEYISYDNCSANCWGKIFKKTRIKNIEKAVFLSALSLLQKLSVDLFLTAKKKKHQYFTVKNIWNSKFTRSQVHRNLHIIEGYKSCLFLLYLPVNFLSSSGVKSTAHATIRGVCLENSSTIHLNSRQHYHPQYVIE
jgi:hypothetical protein